MMERFVSELSRRYRVEFFDSDNFVGLERQRGVGGRNVIHIRDWI